VTNSPSKGLLRTQLAVPNNLALRVAFAYNNFIVDWSPLTDDQSQQLLRASLPVGGRSITLYEEVHPDSNNNLALRVAFAYNNFAENHSQGVLLREIKSRFRIRPNVAKYSFTYGANWISPSTPCVRFNYAQKPLR
jgi:hypothetical protein